MRQYTSTSIKSSTDRYVDLCMCAPTQKQIKRELVERERRSTNYDNDGGNWMLLGFGSHSHSFQVHRNCRLKKRFTGIATRRENSLLWTNPIIFFFHFSKPKGWEAENRVANMTISITISLLVNQYHPNSIRRTFKIIFTYERVGRHHIPPNITWPVLALMISVVIYVSCCLVEIFETHPKSNQNRK